MSEKICRRDQSRLDRIFEQVKALTDVVDELRTEVNDLKRISLGARREDILLKCTKVNCEIDRAGPLNCVQTYRRNVGDSTTIGEIRRLAENNQVSKCDSIPPSYVMRSKGERDKKEAPYRESPPAVIALSTIYTGLKSFKNRLVKVVRNFPVPRLSLKSTRAKCVTSSRQRQLRPSREEESEKSVGFDEAAENDVSKCIDTNGWPDDSTDTSLTSDASAQADITTYSRQEDKKSTRSLCRDVTKNNDQTGPLMSDNGLIFRTNGVTGESSKGRAKQMFSKNKWRKYKICSCGSQCPYALHKLPCCDRNSAPKRRIADEVDGSALECSSLGERNNFPKFVNIDAELECCKACLADFAADESSSSSLSVELEVDVCGDRGRPENNEFSQPSRTKAQLVRETITGEDDVICNYIRSESEPPMRVNLKGSQEEFWMRTGDFSHDGQAQCPSMTLRAARKVSICTSTPAFRKRSGSANRPYRATDTTKRANFPEAITAIRMKMNMYTQTEKCLHYGRPRSVESPNDSDLGSERYAMSENYEDENERIFKSAICYARDFAEEIRPRNERHDARFALRVEKSVETRSRKPWNQATNAARYVKYNFL